jgi:hypothetical protein
MFWKRKSKEEKIVDEMKEKKQQVDKLKEEIEKMGKLVLKDGKLQKVEDTPKETVPVQSPPQPTTRQPDVSGFEEQVANVGEQVRRETYSRQQQFSPRGPPQEYVTEGDIYGGMQMPQPQVQTPFRQPQYPQQMPPQYPQQAPPQYPQYPQQAPVAVNIEMVTGSVVQIQVPIEQLDNFIEGLNTAIDSQSSFPLNNRVINGRNVVLYTYE